MYESTLRTKLSAPLFTSYDSPGELVVPAIGGAAVAAPTFGWAHNATNSLRDRVQQRALREFDGKTASEAMGLFQETMSPMKRLLMQHALPKRVGLAAGALAGLGTFAGLRGLDPDTQARAASTLIDLAGAVTPSLDTRDTSMEAFQGRRRDRRDAQMMRDPEYREAFEELDLSPTGDLADFDRRLGEVAQPTPAPLRRPRTQEDDLDDELDLEGFRDFDARLAKSSMRLALEKQSGGARSIIGGMTDFLQGVRRRNPVGQAAKSAVGSTGNVELGAVHRPVEMSEYVAPLRGLSPKQQYIAQNWPEMTPAEEAFERKMRQNLRERLQRQFPEQHRYKASSQTQQRRQQELSDRLVAAGVGGGVLAGSSWGQRALSSLYDRPERQPSARLETFDQLEDLFGEMKVPWGSVSFEYDRQAPRSASRYFDPVGLRDILTARNLPVAENDVGGRVYIGGPDIPRHVVRHELGHAAGGSNSPLRRMMMQGKVRAPIVFGGGIGSLLMAGQTDPDSNRNKAIAAGLGVASVAPTLAEEVAADADAIRAIRRAGQVGEMAGYLKSRLPGWGTYALLGAGAVATPMAMMKTRSMLQERRNRMEGTE